LLQLLQYAEWTYAERRQANPVEIDVNTFVLQPVETDVLHALETLQLIAHLLERLAHFTDGKTGCGNRDGGYSDPPEIVIDDRSQRTLGETTCGLSSLCAHFLPDRRKLCVTVMHGDLGDHHPRTHGRHDVLDLGQLAQPLFQRASDQLLDAFDRHAGILDDDQSVLDKDGRLFLRRKTQEGQYAAEQNQDGGKQGQAAGAERRARDIH